MTGSRSKLTGWIVSVLSWDGFLPVIVILTPTLLADLFPNQRGIREVVAGGLLPIGAFFVRLFVGQRRIVSNQCSAAFRGLQFVALGCGAILLVLMDTLMILTMEMPPGVMFDTTLDQIVCVVLFGIYFCLMAIAMYPGNSDSARSNVAESSVHSDADFDSFGDRRLDDWDDPER